MVLKGNVPSNAMAADHLAPCVARPYTTMLLTPQGKWTHVFQEKEFEWPEPFPVWQMSENSIKVCFLNEIYYNKFK